MLLVLVITSAVVDVNWTKRSRGKSLVTIVTSAAPVQPSVQCVGGKKHRPGEDSEILRRGRKHIIFPFIPKYCKINTHRLIQ